MIKSVLGSHRMIGMIQPVPEKSNSSKIISHRVCWKNSTETNDNRFLIELSSILSLN